MPRARVLIEHLDATAAAAAREALSSEHDVASAGDDGIDVVVCGLNADGIRLLEQPPRELRNAAFVLLYGENCEAEAAAGLRAGAFYCLPIPPDRGVLRAVVSRGQEFCALQQRASRHASKHDSEIKEAAALQHAMLAPPESRLASAGISVALRCRPSVKVGGDIADYAEADGRATLLIADVAGHGMGAAMLTTVVKSAFAASKASGFAPADVVERVASGLRPFEPARFVTLIVAQIDRRAGSIEYVNAGHPTGLVFSRGRIVAELASNAPLLMPGMEELYAVDKISIPENAAVLLFTDGVIDAPGSMGRFGVDGVTSVLQHHPGGGAALLDGIISAVDAFSGDMAASDDLTLITATIGLPGLG